MAAKRKRGASATDDAEEKKKTEEEPRVISSMEEFREQVYEMILHGDDGELGRRRRSGGVPEGRVTTYGAIAAALGSKKVARHVGWALNALSQGSDDLSELVPWWRVVNSRGEVSFRPSDRTGAGGSSRQAELLEAEGIVFTPGPGGTRKIKDFDELLWTFEPQT